LVTNSHIISDKCGNHFSQQLKVHEVNNVRQTEIHRAEPIVPEPSACEFDMAIEKLKRQTTRY
jgi:hypothetical protein